MNSTSRLRDIERRLAEKYGGGFKKRPPRLPVRWLPSLLCAGLLLAALASAAGGLSWGGQGIDTVPVEHAIQVLQSKTVPEKEQLLAVQRIYRYVQRCRAALERAHANGGAMSKEAEEALRRILRTIQEYLDELETERSHGAGKPR